MRLGLLEIVIILIIITLFLVVTRIVRAGRNITNTDKTSPEMSPGQTTGKPGEMTQRLRAMGIIFIIVGILSLLAGIGLFKGIYWSLLWAFLAVAVGLIMIFISGKRK
jgi:Ca2+/Na+ antiporter